MGRGPVTKCGLRVTRREVGMAEVPRSQNGYPADHDATDVFVVPGSLVRLRLRRGPCAEVLTAFAARFDDEAEDIDRAGAFPGDCDPGIPGDEPSRLADDWSYAPRPVRGSTTVISNHASGTAIDLNATQHPRGAKGTFTSSQVKAIRRILDDFVDPVTGRCVIRWGGDYVSAPCDEMHFEINAPEAAVARVAERIQGVSKADVISGLKDGSVVRNRSWKAGDDPDGKYVSVATAISQLEDDGDWMRATLKAQGDQLDRIEALLRSRP